MPISATHVRSLQQPEDLARGAGRCADRILANRTFLFGDRQVEAVERLARHVVLDALVLAYQAELRAAIDQTVVLLGETDFARSSA